MYLLVTVVKVEHINANMRYELIYYVQKGGQKHVYIQEIYTRLYTQ